MAQPGAEGAVHDLVRSVRRFHERGWCDGTSGNYSVVLSREPLRLAITPSGLDKGRLEAEDLLEVAEDGRPLVQGGREPSAETAVHLRLAGSAGAGAILHTHSVWGTLLGEHYLARGGLSLTGYEMLKGLEGVRSHEEQVFVPVVENTQDMAALAARVEEQTRSRPGLLGLLISGHGLYAWGRDVDQAFRHVEVFEFLFGLIGRRCRLAPYPG